MKHVLRCRWLALLCCLSVLTCAPGVWAQNFAPGNLVIYRVGSGTAALSGSATPVFLDEYTPAGTLVRSVALPTAANGNNRTLTASGTANSEGLLSRSVDGRYILLTGYDAAVGTANITNTTSATVNRVVARVAANGTIDASTALTDFSSGNNPRSAVSTNGNDIWVAGGAGGIRYTTLGATTSTQLNTTTTNLRQAAIVNGQLYVSSLSGTTRIATVGTGTPTTSGQTITNLPGFTASGSPYGFFFADLNPSVAGVDVLYVADDTSPGQIQKYSLVSGNWTLNGTIATASVRGLTASISGTTVTLYATSSNALFSVTDATGYNVAPTASATSLVTAPANTAFRGVAFAPVTPCPSITASLAGNATICNGSSTNLAATITGGTGPYSLTYSNGTTNTVVSNYTSGATIAVNPTTNTTYTLVNVTDANTCAATVSGSAQVTVNQNPTTANAGPAQTIFTGQAATLAANAPTSGTGMWSVTSGPSTVASQFSDVTSPTATFTPAGGMGSYVLTWTISNSPCTPSTSNVTITVSNPTVNLSVSSTSGSEAAQTAITVTATAVAPVVGDQTVSLVVTGTGITAGDYTLSSNTITIPNGQTTGSVTFTVVDDNAVEGTETATLTISNPSAGIALGNTVAQNITITDNDIAPGLSINDVSMAEGNSGTTLFTFTVSLATPAPAGGVSFNYTTANGTATAGTDYVATSGTGTIPEGSSTRTISVQVNGNTTYEPDKTFYVNVSSVTGASVSKGQGTGTILNDDAQPLPDLTVALSGPASATTGQAYNYSLVVSNSGNADASNVSVAFTLPNGVAYASAMGSSNFVATQNGTTVSFTGGALTQGSSTTLAIGVTSGMVGTVTVSPGAAVVDPNSTITESNENNNSSTQTVTTTVVTPNQPPVVPALPNQSGTVAVAFTYTVPAFTDPENEALTYTITGVPAGLTVDNSTRTISGTPTTTGVSTVTAVATDPQSATAAGTFTITINANQAPVAPTIGNQTATVGTAYSYVVPAFTDTENQTLTYTASGIPSPLTFDPATRTISGTPTATGTSNITITATDPANNVTNGSFTLTVNSAPAAGNIQITEYMYNGSGGEFIELTNVGNAPVDMTGWSFDDASRTPGSFAIGAFGVVQPGESIIISELPATVFRTNWYLPESVKVVGGNNQNLGNGDEINIYDASNNLIDRLTYGNTGNVITNGVSAWPSTPNLVATTAASWQLSAVGDAQNSYAATAGNVANPGGYYIPLNRVLVRESGGTTTVTEGGATDTYTVALNSQPSSDVTVSINAGSQLSVSSSTLIFTPANYNTAQTVTVTAVDDNVYQGAPRSVTITQTVTSSDVAYNGLVANPVSVTIVDNDSPVTSPPTIQAVASTTAYLSLPASGQGYVSGVINDPTDPANTQGINFTLADTDTDVNTLTVTAFSNNGNATVNLTGSGNSRNLKITPVNVGYSTITVTVSDGANTANYVVNYAASAASVVPSTTRFHTGASDASTAIPVDANYMLVGDDESQVLRLYNRQNSGLPVAGFDFTSSLGLTDLSGGVPREVDLELSVRQNNRIFWLGSESNADGGNSRPNRNRIYATDLSGSGASTSLSYVGRYDYLRDDIINWDVNNGHGKGANYYGLQASAAAGIGSKQPSGYNIEGAEFAPDGSTVYLGFRAPQVLPGNRTKALVVPVTNLTSLISGQSQGAATFGAPIELNLGGRGIREIRRNSNNQYVIIAGPAGDAGASPNDFRLFTWTGNAGDAPVERNANLTALMVNGSFESIVEVPASLDNNTSLQLLVDNGDAVYYNDGTAAKELSQNNFKKFRSEIVSLGSPLNTAPVATVNNNQTATVGTAFTYTVNAFTDAETPTGLTYATIISPANGLSFDPATRIISGTPTVSGVSSVTITATDPGSLSASTTFTITVSPVPVTALTVTATANPTQIFTSGSTTLTGVAMGGTAPYSYAFTGPGTITPNGNTATVSGLSAGVQTFTVTATDATTPTAQTSFTTVSVTVTQANTAPTIANAVGPQSATVGVEYTLSLANIFTDAETPNQLTLSVSGLPAGLSLSGTTISGIPSMTVGSPYTVTVTATDPGSLSASTTFTLTVNPAPPTPTVPFSITGVTLVSCQTLSVGERQISFTPQYAGVTGESISFRVANESTPTTAAGPYTLKLYTDNPVISLRAMQGSGSEVSYAYNWLAACNNTGTPTPTNTAPTVANAVSPQSATVGMGYTLSVATVFTDAETPNQLTLSASGLPAGLSLSGMTISGTASVSGVSNVTLTATDPGNLSTSTQFTLTVNPAAGTTPTAPFSITGVTLNSCVADGSGARQISFTPQYAGVTGESITFRVANENTPTTAAGPYTLKLYTDNPIISLRAMQGSGSEVSYAYNWLAACNNTTPMPTNTAPTVANPIGSQSATVGSAYTLSLAGVFTDAETPNQLTLSASGLPAGLSLSGTTISGTPSTSTSTGSPYTVTVTATDPGNLSINTGFVLTVSPAAGVNPTVPFSITGVTLVSCTADGAGARRISFTPQYAGVTGESISFRVVNESEPTTAAGPYSLRLYTDNPVINLRAMQGNGSEVAYAYNWLAACNNNGRVRAQEQTEPLIVTVLGNPVVGETVDIEIRGAAGQSVRVLAIDGRGHTVSDNRIEQASDVEKTAVRLRQAPGVYLLQVSTGSQQQTVKLIRE